MIWQCCFSVRPCFGGWSWSLCCSHSTRQLHPLLASMEANCQSLWRIEEWIDGWSTERIFKVSASILHDIPVKRQTSNWMGLDGEDGMQELRLSSPSHPRNMAMMSTMIMMMMMMMAWVPGPGVLRLQLIMQFAVGLLAAPRKSRIIWQDIYAALVALPLHLLN